MTKILTDRACGVILVRKEEAGSLFLIIKEAEGYWGFPKGHKENNESDIETARRELQEETGVKNIEIVEGQTFSCSYPIKKDGVDYEKTVLYFLAFANNDEAKVQENFAHEILDIKWVDFNEANRIFDFRPTQKVLKEANEFLKNNF